MQDDRISMTVGPEFQGGIAYILHHLIKSRKSNKKDAGMSMKRFSV